MTDLWAISMLITGALFAGGAVSIAWERLPAWRATDLSDFRVAFAHTLRRVDRLQPALLTVCLVSTIGFALSIDGGAQLAALLAAVGFLVVLVGSARCWSRSSGGWSHHKRSCRRRTPSG